MLVIFLIKKRSYKMDNGIYDNISNEKYHTDKKSYSSSLVKLMHTPALAKYYMTNPLEYKDVYRIGTAIHTYVLEPDKFNDNYFTGISAPRRGAANLSEWDEFFASHNAYDITQLKAADWFQEFEKQTGKSILTSDELQQIIAMSKSVQSNDRAVELLHGGKAEQSIYWTDEETGLKLRVRPDYLGDEISDLKSVKSAYAPFFAKSAYDLGYHISQAMYQDGVNSITHEDKPFNFICVEKQPPYLCAVHAFDRESSEEASRQYRNYVTKLASCIEFDYWEGLKDDSEMSLPAYGFKN